MIQVMMEAVSVEYGSGIRGQQFFRHKQVQTEDPRKILGTPHLLSPLGLGESKLDALGRMWEIGESETRRMPVAVVVESEDWYVAVLSVAHENGFEDCDAVLLRRCSQWTDS